MGLMRMLFSNSKPKEFTIEVPTLVLRLTKDELKKLEVNDMHRYIIEYGKYVDDMILVMEHDKIYLFVSYYRKRLKCTVKYKNYLGPIGKLSSGTLEDWLEDKICKLVITSYITLATRKSLEEFEELDAISQDIRALKENFDLVADTEISVPGNYDIIKYQYQYIDGKLTVEKTEDYKIFSPRDLAIRIGEAYVLDIEGGYTIYGGTNAGTVTVPVGEIDRDSTSILYKELIKDNAKGKLNGFV